MCCSHVDASSDDGDGGGSVDDDGGASVDRDGVSESVAVKPTSLAMLSALDPSTQTCQWHRGNRAVKFGDNDRGGSIDRDGVGGTGAVALSSLAMVAVVNPSTQMASVASSQSR